MTSIAAPWRAAGQGPWSAIVALGGICVLALPLALPSPAYGDVIQDPPAVLVTSTPSARATWTHEVKAATDRYAIVAVTVGQVTGTLPTAASVTFAGRAMSYLGGVANGVVVRVDLWGLPDPPLGLQPVEVTLTGDGAVVAGSLSFSGLDLAAPLGPVATGVGGGPTAAVTLASAPGDHVLDLYGSHEGQPAPVAGQSTNWIDRNAISGASSSRPGAPSVTMAWDRNGGTVWAMAAVSLRPRVRTIPPDGGAPGTIDGATDGASGGGGDGGDGETRADDGSAIPVDGGDGGDGAAPRRVQYDLGCACRSGAAAPIHGAGLLVAFFGLALVMRLARRRRRCLRPAGRR